MIKTKEIDATDYLIYKEKATQAYDTMCWTYDNQKWSACGREAVFTCINSCDALLAKYKRLRNISKNHMDVVYIVTNLLPMKDAKTQSTKIRKIIAMKNLIDYENKAFNSKQASEIFKLSERFYIWALNYL